MKRVVQQTFIALIATVLVLELTLQLVGAFGSPLFTRSSGIPGSPDAITILCVGDSHTYGATLPDEESYPTQLQALLGKRFPSHDFRIVNLGVSGVNSTFVADRLERQILQIRPRLVMVSAGLNNRWFDLGAAQTGERSWDAVRQFLLRVKLFRLVAVASETAYAPPESGDGRWGHPDHDEIGKALRRNFVRVFGGKNHGQVNETAILPSSDQVRRTLEHDIERMVKTARRLGVPIIWYNYQGIVEGQRFVNDVIRITAARLDVAVVETAQSHSRALAHGYEYGDLFVDAAGPHPTGILYGYVVEDMLPIVASALNLEN